MTSTRVKINLETGIHARPAAMFVKLANRFPCEIQVEKDSTVINGKSIMGLMMLAMGKGSQIVIRAEGDKEQEAIKALSALILNDFEMEDV